MLVLDPGMHTAPIRRADVDRDGRFAVTASDDKTVRVWSLADGRLERTIRLPAGPGNVGKAYAVAISPDGATIAAGGWTRWTEADQQEQIYLFDRESGAMTGRIDGLPNVVIDLAFSRDGDRLAAVLGGGRPAALRARRGRTLDARWRRTATTAMRATASPSPPTAGWRPRAATAGCGSTTPTATAAPLGRDAARPALRPRLQPGGRPAGGRLRRFDRGGCSTTARRWRRCRRRTSAASTTATSASVAWSADGATLFAAGRYDDGSGSPVVAWDGGGAGPRRLLPAGDNTVMSLRPLPDGALLVAAADPWLGVLAADGTPRWTQGAEADRPARPAGATSRSRPTACWSSSASSNGGEDRLRFDVAALKLLPPADDGRVAPPVQDSLAVAGWVNSTAPTLDGAPLPLEPYEIARSLAIQPDGGRFLLGTDWWLRAFDKAGAALWQRPVPGAVWAVNISGDGRLAVAAYGDGTIRWHRMEDGAELLALFPMPDGENWVAWTPEGVYAASPGARGVLRWHVNHGWDAAGEAVPVSAIPETYRPEVIPHVLPQLGTAGAIAVAELAKIRAAVQRATGSDVAARRPPARAGDRRQRLRRRRPAPRARLRRTSDARDVAAALRNSQSSLYAKVLVSELRRRRGDQGRRSSASSRAMRDAMRSRRRRPGGDPVLRPRRDGRRDKFYLLPHGVDARSTAAIKATALLATDFHDEIAAIAQHGRVILFLDACRSGGADAPLDRSLRRMLNAPNVTVFTSSSAGELSVEDDAWQNGAFTEALLEALRRDPDRDGLVRDQRPLEPPQRPRAGADRRPAAPRGRDQVRRPHSSGAGVDALRRPAFMCRGTRLGRVLINLQRRPPADARCLGPPGLRLAPARADILCVDHLGDLTP